MVSSMFPVHFCLTGRPTTPRLATVWSDSLSASPSAPNTQSPPTSSIRRPESTLRRLSRPARTSISTISRHALHDSQVLSITAGGRHGRLATTISPFQTLHRRPFGGGTVAVLFSARAVPARWRKGKVSTFCLSKRHGRSPSSMCTHSVGAMSCSVWPERIHRAKDLQIHTSRGSSSPQPERRQRTLFGGGLLHLSPVFWLLFSLSRVNRQHE